MRKVYPEFLNLVTEAAKLNGYKDGTEFKVKRTYESDTFVQEIADTWSQLKPLYEQIHAYVRNILSKK